MSVISGWLPLISLGLVALMATYVLMLKRSVVSQQKSVVNEVAELSKELQGLSHASIGIGRRTVSLDKEIEVLKTGIDEIRNNDPSTVSYSEASRLVELGADVDDLMNTCGISRPEAELVTALTRSKKQGSVEGVTVSKSDERVPVLTVEV